MQSEADKVVAGVRELQDLRAAVTAMQAVSDTSVAALGRYAAAACDSVRRVFVSVEGCGFPDTRRHRPLNPRQRRPHAAVLSPGTCATSR
jgi:hypothetical protein